MYLRGVRGLLLLPAPGRCCGASRGKSTEARRREAVLVVPLCWGEESEYREGEREEVM